MTCPLVTPCHIFLLLTIRKDMTSHIGGSKGRAGARPSSPRVQILLYRHTKFSKSNHLKTPCPPTRSMPPLREILGPPLSQIHCQPVRPPNEHFLKNLLCTEMRVRIVDLTEVHSVTRPCPHKEDMRRVT